MSHRTSDAYSRRPTDDDRRGPDPRDRRRDSHPRGSSDSHKEEKQRRDKDTTARDRRTLLESPRDPPSVAKPARPHVTISSARSERLTRASSTSQSPAESPSIDGTTACEKLVSLCRKHSEAVTNLVKLKLERDPLAKVLKQRQAEYEKSMVKHAEFPSVPEVQNMHRVKYAERVRLLDVQIQKAQDEVDKIIDSIAQAVFGLSSAQNRGFETKTASPTTPTVPLQHQETVKKQQMEIGELKTKIRKIETEHSQERSELKAEFDQRFTDMKEQMVDMMKGMKKDLKEVKALKSVKEEVTGELQEQLRVVRGEFEERQTERETTEMSTFIAAERPTLLSDMAGLLSRVDKLTGQLTQNTQDTVELRNSLIACTRRVDDEARKVEEHEAKLSSLDIDALEEVAEKMSIDFPDLQRRVAGIQAKLDGVSQEIDTKQQALFAQVQQFVGQMGGDLGGLVDEVEKSVMACATRIKTLEEAPMGRPDASTGTSLAASVEMGSISSDMVLIKSDLDSTKTAVGRLTQELSDKVGQVDQKVSATSEDINNQLTMIRHSITVLDSQYNNLSTRSLAEHIIGQLEQIYPSGRHDDIDELKRLANGLSSRIDTLEGQVQEVQEFKGKEAKFDASKVSSEQERLHQLLDESLRPGTHHNPMKRKRTDLGMNGAEHTVTNGTG
ncbi:hypothetical protein C8A00DRAFT_13703 [Chaetomidium leptoderma]|uniref:Uncharacterized protein n=1 Tax=Chaetomidium leptoderma TaxID=669021 RepID=A0AAN6ZYU6_9PEZI|nr:hypothetical protein C8A00DRAFT_13703 [Chaetomidium leptoderma]